jgi:rare lipoprotein A (peptidoglycan hydrolase)
LKRITALAVLCSTTILLIWLLFQVVYFLGQEMKRFQILREKPPRTKLTEGAKVHEWQTVASWYGPGFQNKKRADGGIYNMYRMSVAHKFLPFGTELKITNLTNFSTIYVKVLDRGPYIKGRDIDLSYKAAKMLGAIKPGLIPVKIEILS